MRAFSSRYRLQSSSNASTTNYGTSQSYFTAQQSKSFSTTQSRKMECKNSSTSVSSLLSASCFTGTLNSSRNASSFTDSLAGMQAEVDYYYNRGPQNQQNANSKFVSEENQQGIPPHRFNVHHKYFQESASPTKTEQQKQQLNKEPIAGRLALIYTCKPCNTKNTCTFSKHAYEKGVVIVTCKNCENKHVIADNLGWFGPEKNIEEILKQKQESVYRITSDTTEFLADHLASKLLNDNGNASTSQTENATETLALGASKSS